MFDEGGGVVMNDQDNKLDLIGIKTDDGCIYISQRSKFDKYTYGDDRGLHIYLFDNKKAATTFDKRWVRVDCEPKIISKLVSQPDINHRYELLDKSLISKTLPEFIEREKVATYNDENYCWIWSDEMSKYQSLYKLIFDKQPDKEIECDFELEIILGVERIVDPTKMEYRVMRTQWKSDGYRNITENDIIYQLADKVILPEILLPQRSCKLSSRDTYKIVRQHIKDKINPELAKITSDYNFCFTVKRRIRLAETVHYTVDVNNTIFDKRKRKPKYVKRQQTEKEKTCFEMTYSPENYRGYTPIKGFEANTQKELKEKIDNYLDGLIKFINTPMTECKQCNGNGVVLSDIKFDMNNREDKK